MNKLTLFLAKPFSLLNPAKNRLFLVFFCGLFATFFLYVFNPFNSHSWKYDVPLAQMIGIWSSGLLAIPILAFSQFVIRPRLYNDIYKNKHFILQIFIEFLLLSIFFFIIFGDRNPFGKAYLNEFLGVIKHTLQLAIIPYAMGLLVLLATQNKQKQITEVQTIIPSVKQNLLSIKDEKNKPVLTLNINHLLFFKSEDNYVAVYYLHEDKPKKLLVRTNLKKLSQELVNMPVLRVHRSYMVNLNQIVSVARAGKGHQLTLKHVSNMKLPVSNSYKEAFETNIQDR